MKKQSDNRKLSKELQEKAIEFGADLAGVANVSDLIDAPSECLFPQIHDHTRDRFADIITTGLPQGRVYWENDLQSLIVIAVNHPASKPEMDWWYGEKNPPGNKLLIQIAKKLADYVRRTYPQINVYLKPYHVEKGGVYLKDAAVVAGLGCIGKNNLLVTPKFGPQVRLRAIGLSANLPSTGAIDYDPCISCQAPCIKACPQNAFDHKLYSEKSNNVHFLPARDGNYSRKQCAMEMELNESAGEQHLGDEATLIKYCRKCEFSCLAGK